MVGAVGALIFILARFCDVSRDLSDVGIFELILLRGLPAGRVGGIKLCSLAGALVDALVDAVVDATGFRRALRLGSDSVLVVFTVGVFVFDAFAFE